MRFLRHKADPVPTPASDPEPDRCTKTTLAGTRCTFPRHGDSPFCRLHEAKEDESR